MSEVLEQLFVTDRDVYETLMSSKQRLTLAVIQQLILDRNIFVSTSLAREDLADYLSTLPHDQNDIASLIEKSTPSARLEKSTFIELPPTVELAEIKDAIRGRAADNAAEKVIIPLTSAKT